MSINPDPLYVACTRPAMKWGVPFDGFVVNGVASLVFGIAVVGSPIALFIGLPVHFALRELCRVDPHFFHKWKMFLETKMKSRTGSLWGGSRLQPSSSRMRRSSDISSYV